MLARLSLLALRDQPMYAALAFLALAIEGAFGYPERVARIVSHPVVWMGALIARIESAWNRAHWSDTRRRLAGVAALLVLLIAAGGTAFALQYFATELLVPLVALVLLGAVASAGIAQRSLYDHVRAVATALDGEGLDAGRRCVARIVGRDPETLDEAGVCRAAIESLAENFSDGVVAPVFWLVVGGLPGVAAYKALNTADSMIGHKSDRYRAYGWAAARLDDLANLPASRLAAVWIALAALVSCASARESLAAVCRDAHHHKSPNAGWPEAAMAGALGLRLAGPRTYAGVTVEDHWMGDGRADATTADIRHALRIYVIACALQFAAVGVVALLVTCTL